MENDFSLGWGGKVPIGDIYFDNNWKLEPKDDITPLEVLHINIMLSFAHYDNVDFVAYIHEHNLERHFINKGEK